MYFHRHSIKFVLFCKQCSESTLRFSLTLSLKTRWGAGVGRVGLRLQSLGHSGCWQSPEVLGRADNLLKEPRVSHVIQ